MKLVYSNRRFNQLSEIHRFDAIGEVHSSDLSLLKDSIFHLLRRGSLDDASSTALILDLSETVLNIHDSEIHAFQTELMGMTQSMNITFILAIDATESASAENKAIEIMLERKIQQMESKINLMDSIRNQITTLQKENEELKDRMRTENKSLKPKSKSFYDQLWGDS